MLTAATVDLFAEQIEGFLTSMKMETANVLRVRLSLEEAMLQWMEHFDDEAEITLETGMRRRRPRIVLRLAGEAFNPLPGAREGEDEWVKSLLGSVGLNPEYRYQNGVNIVELRMNRIRQNPAITLLESVAAGLGIGALGKLLLPADFQAMVLRTVLAPIRDVFFRVLNAAAGPIVFLSVLTAICSIGSVATMGKSGKRLITRFLLLSTLMAVIGSMVAMAVFRPEFALLPLRGEQVSNTLDFFLQIFPKDMLTPIIEGDSPQLILLALVLGNALLTAGIRAGGLVSVIEQADAVALIIADWVGALTPLFVTLLLILGIWNDSMTVLLGVWQPLAVFLVLALACMAAALACVSAAKGVPMGKLVRKVKRSFLVAFRNASVDAAYGDNQACCERRLGVGRELADFGLPLGLIVYMPAGTIACMVFALYAARCYGIETSAVWFVTGIALSAALNAATPPVAGIGLLTYTAIFSRLGIPDSALTIAVLAEILLGYPASAMNQTMLQAEMVLEADRVGQLDRKVLQD